MGDVPLRRRHGVGYPAAQADQLDLFAGAGQQFDRFLRRFVHRGRCARAEESIEIGVVDASVAAGANLGEVDTQAVRAGAHSRGGEDFGSGKCCANQIRPP